MKAGPKAKTKVTEPLSFADAAEHILRGAGKPLTHRELADHATKQGLVQTESETPHISMHVTIRSEMRRREARGEPQRFVFLGNGYFGLADLTEKTKTALDQVRDSRVEAGKGIYRKLTASNNGPNFEVMVADLLAAMGYQDVVVIGGKDDQGVDILCEKRDGIIRTRIAVQCKCKALSSKVGPKDVSTLRDNLSSYQCQQGILVTMSTLNDVAKVKAKEPGKDPIYFIEHDELLDLFAEFSIGIRQENVRYFQIDTSQYGFLA